MTALLGLGTYRVPGEELAAAARRAAGSPYAWIDTAPNYGAGRAHRLLAPALADHLHLRVATKAGFLTPATARAAHAAGVVNTPLTRHSITDRFLRWQTERSRTELGRDRLDAVFVHNPEYDRGDHHELADRLRTAFAVLEEQACSGRLAAYGVATWSGFTEGAFTVPVLDRLATEAAGTREHHLSIIQLPVSLVMDTHFRQALHGRGPIAQAEGRGWEIHASAPLHGGELPSLATPEVAALLREGASVAAACIAAVASCPGISRVLLATGKAAHWSEALGVVGAPAISSDELRTVLDVLAAPL
ncbi:aldo/keto reductase [Streptomyces sp. URMC 123]|uniref:aldo/keto reductase n=1 Tax=Streptomyces sp. URMC 123 TaxID=3423403 RepID=UPI003F1D6A10